MAKLRIAAVGDLHLVRTPPELVRSVFSLASHEADVLLLCGDLTDYGRVDEARALAKELHAVRVPVVGVLGNHDYEAGAADEVRHILSEAGAHMLDGDSVEIEDVGFAGVKGFAGG